MIRAILITIVSTLLASCNETPSLSAGGDTAGCTTRAYDTIGGPIELTDHNNNLVTEKDFLGKPSLVFFGFTYCPDVCPSTLVTIERALRKLPKDTEPPRTVFISVDSERDTPGVLADYLSSSVFPEDVVGLTGTNEELRTVAGDFSAYFNRVETTDSMLEYTMDHSTIVYLMDENWKLKTFFTHLDTDKSIASCLQKLL